MADQACAALDARERSLPDGLTALHIAVLQGDREQLRALLKSREYGADVRSRKGVTPLMLACMYGHTKIFFYLLKKKADPGKTDHRGFTTMDYVQGSSNPGLTREYQDVTTGAPCRNGRRTIYNFLRGCEYGRKHSHPRRPLDPQPGTRSSALPLPRRLFLRSGSRLEFVEVRPLASTEVDDDLGRKSTAVIRGKDDRETIYKISVSGWTGINGQDVLCNKKYSSLVRRICGMYGFELVGTWLDNQWNGDPEEKAGVYKSCHAEKQLAAWLLIESMAEALKTADLTIANVARLKEASPQLPARLRETLIELDHEPCSSCIQFLKLLHQEAGLIIEWKSQNWFVQGQRTSLRRFDGTPVARNGKMTDDVVECEIDIDEVNDALTAVTQEDDDVATDDSSATVTQDPNADTNDDADQVVEDNTPSLEPFSKPRLLLRTQPGEPYNKRGSPIWSWPPPPQPARHGQKLPRATQVIEVNEADEIGRRRRRSD
ncbi:hypothetical protein VPNG_06985 [Cytospora leucostoma]|uniref:Single-strand DNA deaminase toxin A-like C-terminal domain-containing protein n=1 Tax=Cytospora leucostoma TaxID=1230097 RepID=A0A423WN99_9PEZI|nr:hypothetical protein VPNG_06985 [Cytospora leucostoma]